MVIEIPLQVDKRLPRNTVLLGYRGSHSHGTYIPPEKEGIDDIDLIGAAVAAPEVYYGLGKFEQAEFFEGQWDVYDTKNAAHLIRLLRMGCEFLEDGKLRVFREDAEELIAIKQGKRSLEDIKAEAEDLFAVAKARRDRSPLPEKPDYLKAGKLLCFMVKNRLAYDDRIG